jgi:ankyrin repeat protein
MLLHIGTLSHCNMALLSLLTELLLRILECFDRNQDINAFVQTSCVLYYGFIRALYDYDKKCFTSSALLWAATCGNMRTAYNSLDVQPRIDDLQAALLLAVENGHYTMVELLLDHGGSVNAQAGYFGTLLQTASWLGDEQMVQLLIKQGADVNA